MTSPDLPPDDEFFAAFPTAPPEGDEWDEYETDTTTTEIPDPAGDDTTPEPEADPEPEAEDARVFDFQQAQAARGNQFRPDDNNSRFATDYFTRVREGTNSRRVFLAETLARDIMAEGPLAVGIDDRVWHYMGGVWKPTKEIVRDRATRLLREEYTVTRSNGSEHIVRAELRRGGWEIDGSPISKIINFRNGYLDWATGSLREHDPSVKSTIQLRTDWDPDATCPEFDRFLAEVLPEDMIDMVWELIGYLMYSGNPLHKAVMLHGTGRNGKGVFVRAMKNLLGEENISGASLQALAEDRFAPSVLFGKLANICGDIDGSYMEKTAKFKEITGEDHMDAEFKGRDRFQFTNWAVPLFSANRIPGSADVTNGYMARWVVVPFPNDFTGREDRTLTDRISTEEEIRGIAAKAVPALVRLMARGNFLEPESARAAMDDFRRKVDQVRTWIDEQADLNEAHPAMNRTILYSQYKSWADAGGFGKLKSSEFYERLASVGAEVRARGAGDVLSAKKMGGDRVFSGIKLSPVTDPFVQPSTGWGQ